MSPQPQPQQKEKSEAKTNKMSWIKLIQSYLVVFIIHVTSILILAYLISPWSKVDAVIVTGNQAVYDQLIVETSTIELGDFVLQTKQNFPQIEEKIVQELTQIADAHVNMEGINKISIQVDEFETVAYIAKDGSYLRVLENGDVLDELYTISLGNQLILSKFEEGKTLTSMIEELKKVDKPILNLISEIELVEARTNPLFIRVYMNNGNRVLAKIPDFSDKIIYYPQMVQAVEGKKGIFDMEAGIYFIPFKDFADPDLGVDESEGQNLDELTNEE